MLFKARKWHVTINHVVNLVTRSWYNVAPIQIVKRPTKSYKSALWKGRQRQQNVDPFCFDWLFWSTSYESVVLQWDCVYLFRSLSATAAPGINNDTYRHKDRWWWQRRLLSNQFGCPTQTQQCSILYCFDCFTNSSFCSWFFFFGASHLSPTNSVLAIIELEE